MCFENKIVVFLISATCPNPPRLVHGSHDGNDFSVGKKVTYSCNAAYLLEGNTVITCVDGKWVGQVPVCRGKVPLKCSLLINVSLFLFIFVIFPFNLIFIFAENSTLRKLCLCCTFMR